MQNNAADYCTALTNVSKEELVNALHQSLMQFRAIAKHEALTLVDNRGVMATAEGLMAKAGHVGFAS